MPDWLQPAIHAGQTAKHFRVPIAGGTGRAVKGFCRSKHPVESAVLTSVQ